MNPLSTPDSTISLLESFVGRFDQAAVAHAHEELTAEEIASLAAFARGELDAWFSPRFSKAVSRLVARVRILEFGNPQKAQACGVEI
jgi:hypothetical protein